MRLFRIDSRDRLSGSPPRPSAGEGATASCRAVALPGWALGTQTDRPGADIAVLVTPTATIRNPSVTTTDPAAAAADHANGTQHRAASTRTLGSRGSARARRSLNAGSTQPAHDVCAVVVTLAPSRADRGEDEFRNARAPTTHCVSVDAIDAGQGMSVARPR